MLNFNQWIRSFSNETLNMSYFIASRQIRRRVPYAGHLMTPRRLWLNKIPTICDVVVEFPGKIFIFSSVALFPLEELV